MDTCSSGVTHCEIAVRWIPLNLTNVNIRSGNGLVPSINKPFPEPRLSQIYSIKELLSAMQYEACHAADIAEATISRGGGY